MSEVRALFSIRQHGIEQMNERLLGMKTRVLKPKPYFKYVLTPELERIEQQVFNSQGRRGGGSWKQLADVTKERKRARNQDPRINIATGKLLRSLTDSEAKKEGAVRIYREDVMVFGSVAKGADQSQKFRPIIRFTDYDRARWRKMWLNYVKESTVIGVGGMNLRIGGGRNV